MDDGRAHPQRHAGHRLGSLLQAAVARLGLAVAAAVTCLMLVLIVGWAVTTIW